MSISDASLVGGTQWSEAKRAGVHDNRAHWPELWDILLAGNEIQVHAVGPVIEDAQRDVDSAATTGLHDLLEAGFEVGGGPARPGGSIALDIPYQGATPVEWGDSTDAYSLYARSTWS